MLPSKQGWEAPAEGTECLQLNNAGPTLRNTKSSELIRGIQPADLPC